MRHHSARAAFTLVEILAALMFLGLAVPVLLSAFSASGRNAEAAERTVLAAELAEKQLNEVIMQERAAATGGSSSTSSRGGELGAEYPGYRWELEQQSWASDSAVTEYTVRVYFPVRGQERSVELSTLLAGAGSTL